MSLPILGDRRRDVAPGRAARGRGACGRRLGRDRVRLLERPLLRARRRHRARARHAAAGPAGADRARAHRGDRRGPVRARAARACSRRRRVQRRRRLRAQGVDPYPGLQGAAGDAEADARCGRPARLPEFRMRRRHQQHARSRLLAADRGALRGARRALQVPQRRQSRRLQGRRAAPRARPHRARRRDHRRDRRRLRGASRLAQGRRAGLRRSQGRPDPGAAGPSRRRTRRCTGR